MSCSFCNDKKTEDIAYKDYSNASGGVIPISYKTIPCTACQPPIHGKWQGLDKAEPNKIYEASPSDVWSEDT